MFAMARAGTGNVIAAVDHSELQATVRGLGHMTATTQR
jgi:hypothetical protein